MMDQGAVIRRGRRIRPVDSEAAKALLKGSYLTDRSVGKGRILSLSSRDCVVEGAVPLPAWCCLHLLMPQFPGTDAAVPISWAIVRWSEGTRFAAEFLSMPRLQRERLDEFVEQAKVSGSSNLDRQPSDFNR